ncbi:type III secretion chaperone [Candidatus Williamhamiltonella defendens]|uniref:InvB/SpaK family type III secretion system chaperone n=1 Tax=Candidatus Williamhamiltonella defendens TaxID=138072 RepID=UPI00158420D5|nr:type III secretion chaperone [Candidatus Hamiltonella defensa]
MNNNIDLADLVRKALISCGCNENLLQNFDAHSTIQLEFDEKTSIFISRDDEDEIWVWSSLMPLLTEPERETLLERSASLIKEKLEAECDFSATKKLELDNDEDAIHLKVKVDPDYLHDHEKFSNVLTGFFEEIETYSEMLR